MSRPQKKHPVWEGYVLLTKDLRFSHQDALDRVVNAFPGLPVEVIVESQGDMSIVLERLTGQPPEPYANGGRQDARNLRKQITQAALQAAPDDFNAQIRARAAERSGEATATLSQADVRAAGSGKATPEGSYDPGDDPFRVRFAERDAQRMGLEG
jgi:hypothetical protein